VWQAIAVGTISGLAHRFGPAEAVAKMGIAAEIISVGKNNAQWIYRFHTRCMTAPRSGYTLTRLRARQVDDSPHIGPNILQAPAPHSPSTRTTNSTWQHRPSPGPSSGKFRPLQQVDCLFFQSFSTTQLAAVGKGVRRKPGGVHSENRDRHRPPYRRARMSDKSPRQTMTKKSGKSLKEKRAAKRTKASQISQTEALLHTKKR
jgi:hypothetical protein